MNFSLFVVVSFVGCMTAWRGCQFLRMETVPMAGKSSSLRHKFPCSKGENQAPITVIKSVEKGKGKKEGMLINKPIHNNANA